VRAGAESARDRRWSAYLALVRRIPRGRVATYGQVAALAGFPRSAREVGRALASLEAGSDVPWQRVVNASGRVSPRGLLGDETHQSRLLETEGVRFDDRGRIDLEHHRWEPQEARRPRPRRSR